ncbi:uncharacterized protein EAE98_012200 [Botrytis deweyae]|uniref:Protein kinase domain-containing protein n=1 Tax=Botrytis deweyae TaxID=2478750 RepID=A0ABQ7I3U3_9HELO|nr:uncharacterized protein EAE98_012200 [Botrytis deweyae]KAF7910245.1 hypothetical protein EAE98_012200 [Botrytis deweyae]
MSGVGASGGNVPTLVVHFEVKTENQIVSRILRLESSSLLVEMALLDLLWVGLCSLELLTGRNKAKLKEDLGIISVPRRAIWSDLEGPAFKRM